MTKLLQQNLIQITQAIRTAEAQYGRASDSVTLLGVSKKQPASAVELFASHGLLHFGENQVQEAIPKIQALHHLSLIWHFIGHIQSNKTKQIATHFRWIHSVDRAKIAHLLNQHCPANASLNVLIQVNIDNEQQKSGVSLSELEPLAKEISSLPNLNLRGLMTIPKPEQSFDLQCKPFACLKQAFDTLNQKGLHLDTLSMGMSHDYEAAIQEGATMVRIGSKLFGPRSP